MNSIDTILQFVAQHGPERKAYEQLGHLRCVVEGEYLLLNYNIQKWHSPWMGVGNE